MSTLNNIVSDISKSKSFPRENTDSKTNNVNESLSGEKNKTDPKVCHDPSIKKEGIVRPFPNQNKVNMKDGELSGNNMYDTLRIDGIEYPLITINNRNIENCDIYYMTIDYRTLVPSIKLNIRDKHQSEQKIYTTQMSSIIRVCITATVDKVYRKLMLNFRTYDVKINESDPTNVTYYGVMYIEGFRQINTKHIWMDSVCSEKNCNQGGHINANTWEMLHKIAELTGLGFAATDKCKDVPDHIIRNIYSQRYDQFIEQQLLFSGTDEENIFDAWVDFYGYIVMVNVPWVLSQDLNANDLTITASIGIHGTSNDTPDKQPRDLPRILTNYNYIPTASNMEIVHYNMDVDNNSIKFGTLEKIYTMNFDTNLTALEDTDIQTKQSSIDGEFIEDYNTGKNRPTAVYNFNDDKWTGLSGGYDINKQKSIRNAYFRKKRQSILNVELKNVNLGLQRGTLVNISIFDNDYANKKLMFDQVDNLGKSSDEIDESKVNMPSEYNKEDIIMDDRAFMPNLKLSGMYYIDGMTFEYERHKGRIVQILHLIKKGNASGYNNRHTNPRAKIS